MALTTLPGDEKEKDTLNPGQQNYDRRFNDIAQAEEQGTFDTIANNYDQAADSDQENRNIRNIQERESNGNEVASNSFKSTYSGQKNKVKGKAWFKKRGPLFGIGGGLGIVGLIFAALTGNAFLLTNLNMNAFSHNDVRGTLLERRLIAAINEKMGTSSPCDTTKAACRAGKMPKVMLSAMAEKNIIAVNADGSKIAIEGNGYVDSNPYGYEIDDGKGGRKILPSNEFVKEYKANPTFRKSFKGAYNMRFLGYNGKYMVENFFKKNGLNRDGGLAADETLDESTVNEKIDEKLQPNTSADSESGAKNSFKERFQTLLKGSADKAKKTRGDPVLLVGTIGCTAINMPRFAAGTYRAIQTAQILVLLQDVVLSPGGMQKAGDGKSSAIAAIGKLLTDKGKSSNGADAKSALDSPILQSAIGVNKNKIKPNKFTPGYALLKDPIVQASGSASAATKETCNLINSPQAALVSAGIEGAISVGTAGTGAVVIGALKAIGALALTIGAVDAAMQIANDTGVTDAIATAAYDAVKGNIGNYVEGVKYQDLGDALGMAILAYFPQAGLVGGGAVLKTSQVDAFSETIASVENEYRDEDIATLSPFDTSSQYTFLGSIVAHLSPYTVPGDPIKSSISTLGYLLKSPFNFLNESAFAATSRAETECGNAAEFGLEDDVAVNAGGYPCVGLPPEALEMSRGEARNLVAGEFDENTGAPTVEANPITGEGNSITAMMNDCSTGDLDTMSGCTIDPVDDPDYEKRAAESVYMLDYQVENILSGNDEETSENASTAPTAGRPENTVDSGQGWITADNTDYSNVACDPRTTDVGVNTNPDFGTTIRLCAVTFNSGASNLNNGMSGDSSIVSSLISTNVMNMFEDAQKANVSLGISDGFRAAGGADYTPGSKHSRGLAVDLGTPAGGNTFCFTVGGWGSQESAEAACAGIGGIQYQAYQWLKENASKYGFYNLRSEPWHWSPGED